MTAGLSEIHGVELAIAVGEGKWEVRGASITIIVCVICRLSLFLRGSKLHGVMPEKHIGTPAIPVVVGVGTTMAVMVDLVVGLEVIVMETMFVIVD